MNALIFDVDDTLYDRCDSFTRAYDCLFADRWNPDRRRLFDAFVSHGMELFESSMNGSMPLELMRLRRFQMAMGDFDASVTDDEAAAFADAYTYEQEHVRSSETIRSMLALCARSSWFCGVITNGKSDYQRNKCISLGLDRYFGMDHIIASGDTGHSKPDLRIFQYAQERWHLIPEQTWYVGDSYSSDVEGARAAGWNTIWLDKKKEAAAMTDCRANIIVHSEEELSALLSAMLK